DFGRLALDHGCAEDAVLGAGDLDVESLFHDVDDLVDDEAHRASLVGEHQDRSEEHTSELQSPCNLVCRLLLEKKKTSRIHQKIQLIRGFVLLRYLIAHPSYRTISLAMVIRRLRLSCRIDDWVAFHNVAALILV